MATESTFTGKLLTALNSVDQTVIWKASDRYQVGIPDVVGSHRGLFVGIEVKYEGVLNINKPYPAKHPFSGPQVRRMVAVRHTGGLLCGVVGCGNQFIAVLPENIDLDTGRVTTQDNPRFQLDPQSAKEFFAWLITMRLR